MTLIQRDHGDKPRVSVLAWPMLFPAKAVSSCYKGENMRKCVAFLAVPAVLGLVIASAHSDDVQTPKVLNYKMKGIDGSEVNLAKYKGNVVLFVNVASKCGLTPQYKGLQALYEKYHDKGFIIIGVPANDFGAQEPGTDAEIAKFCSTTYNVTFLMLSKVHVKGKGQTPLYQYLTSKETNPKFGGDIQWNFTKFLVSREGRIVNRFEPQVSPESAEIKSAIEAELAKK
jgi:glutathione peroxidase